MPVTRAMSKKAMTGSRKEGGGEVNDNRNCIDPVSAEILYQRKQKQPIRRAKKDPVKATAVADANSNSNYNNSGNASANSSVLFLGVKKGAATNKKKPTASLKIMQSRTNRKALRKSSSFLSKRSSTTNLTDNSLLEEFGPAAPGEIGRLVMEFGRRDSPSTSSRAKGTKIVIAPAKSKPKTKRKSSTKFNRQPSTIAEDPDERGENNWTPVGSQMIKVSGTGTSSVRSTRNRKKRRSSSPSSSLAPSTSSVKGRVQTSRIPVANTSTSTSKKTKTKSKKKLSPIADDEDSGLASGKSGGSRDFDTFKGQMNINNPNGFASQLNGLIVSGMSEIDKARKELEARSTEVLHRMRMSCSNPVILLDRLNIFESMAGLGGSSSIAAPSPAPTPAATPSSVLRTPSVAVVAYARGVATPALFPTPTSTQEVIDSSLEMSPNDQHKNLSYLASESNVSSSSPSTDSDDDVEEASGAKNPFANKEALLPSNSSASATSFNKCSQQTFFGTPCSSMKKGESRCFRISAALTEESEEEEMAAAPAAAASAAEKEEKVTTPVPTPDRSSSSSGNKTVFYDAVEELSIDESDTSAEVPDTTSESHENTTDHVSMVEPTPGPSSRLSRLSPDISTSTLKVHFSTSATSMHTINATLTDNVSTVSDSDDWTTEESETNQRKPSDQDSENAEKVEDDDDEDDGNCQYDITMYEDLKQDEDVLQEIRKSKGKPEWATGDALMKELYFQNPKFMFPGCWGTMGGLKLVPETPHKLSYDEFIFPKVGLNTSKLFPNVVDKTMNDSKQSTLAHNSAKIYQKDSRFVRA